MRRFLKICGYLCLVLVVLLVVGYFVVSSAWFIQGQVLPRVSRAAGLPVTAEGVSFSPFSRLELTGVQAGAKPSPLFSAKVVRIRYRLMALLRGQVKVDEVLLDGARVELVQNADGTWNLPPSQPPVAPPAAKPGGKGGIPGMPDITNVQVRDFTFVLDRKPGPQPLHVELTGFNLSIPAVRAATPVKLDFTGRLSATQGDQVKLIGSRVSGQVTADLGPDFMPRQVTIDKHLTELDGSARGLKLNGHELNVRIALVLEGTTYQVKEFRVEETADGKAEAALAITGSFQPDPLSCDLTVRIDPVSSAALNLAGALAGGVDFGQTYGRYTGRIALKSQTELVVTGDLRFSQVTVNSPQLRLPPMPPMEFAVNHDLLVNLAAKTARVNAMTVRLADQTQEIVAMQLSDPLTLSWGGGKEPVTVAPARLTLVVKKLNLALAAPFLPAKGAVQLLGGTVDANLAVEVADLGQNVTVRGTLDAGQVRIANAGRELPALGLHQDLTAQFQGFRKLSGTFKGKLAAGAAEVLAIDVGADLDVKTLECTITADVPLLNETVLQLAPQAADLAGMIRALKVDARTKATLSAGGKIIALSGDVKVPVLEARLPDGTAVPRAESALAFQVTLDLNQSLVHAKELNLAVRQEGQQVLTLALLKPTIFCWAPGTTAGADLRATDVRLTVDRLNPALANPFLTKSGVSFTSGSFSGDLTAGIARMGQDLNLKGALTGNAVTVRTASGEVKDVTLKVQMDASLKDFAELTVRQVTADLAAAGAQALQASVSGSVDLKKMSGDLTLQVPVVNEALFKAVPSDLQAKLPAISALKLNSELQVTFKDAGKTFTAKGRILVPTLTAVPPGAASPLTVNAEVNLDAELTAGNELRVRKLTLDANQDRSVLGNLAVRGNVFLPPAQGESVVNIESSGLNLYALAGLVTPAKPATAPKPASPPPPAPAKGGKGAKGGTGPIGLKEEPPAIDLGPLNLTANLSLNNVTYSEVTVSQLRGTIRVAKGQVEIKPLDITLNESPIHVEGTFDLTKPGYQYTLAAKIERLALGPLVNSFAPTLRNQVQGQVKSFELNVQGSGLTPANLSRNFRGTLNLQGEKIVVENMKALADLATKTGIPELSKLTFDTATVQLFNEEGHLRIGQFSVLGPEERLDVTGTLNFDVFLDVKARLGLAGAVEKRVTDKGLQALFSEREGIYAMIRATVPYKGYPGQVSGADLAKQLLVPNVLNTVLEGVSKAAANGKGLNAQNILGNILNPGVAPAPTQTGAAGTGAVGTGTAPATPTVQPTTPGTVLAPQPYATPATQPLPGTTVAPGVTQPATGTGDQPPVKKKKPKTKDLLREMGTDLLNNALQPRK